MYKNDDSSVKKLNTDHLVLRWHEGSDMEQLFLEAIAEATEAQVQVWTEGKDDREPYLVEILHNNPSEEVYTRYRIVDQEERLKNVLKKLKAVSRKTGRKRGTGLKVTKQTAAGFMRSIKEAVQDRELSNAINLAELAGIDLVYGVGTVGGSKDFVNLYTIEGKPVNVGQPRDHIILPCRDLRNGVVRLMSVSTGMSLISGQTSKEEVESVVKRAKALKISEEKFMEKVRESTNKSTQEELRALALKNR